MEFWKALKILTFSGDFCFFFTCFEEKSWTQVNWKWVTCSLYMSWYISIKRKLPIDNQSLSNSRQGHFSCLNCFYNWLKDAFWPKVNCSYVVRNSQIIFFLFMWLSCIGLGCILLSTSCYFVIMADIVDIAITTFVFFLYIYRFNLYAVSGK